MFLNYSFTEEQTEYLNKVWFLARMQDDEEEVVCETLDFEQSSEDEKEALHNLVRFTMDMKHSGEWIDMDDSVEGRIYILLLDELEMHKDMCAYEEEELCHELFANNHFDHRITHNYFAISKRSEMDIYGTVTHIGQDYGTLDTDYGKVFIPKHLLTGKGIGHYADEICENELIKVRAQFKGFQSSRMTAMPWRAIAVKSDCGLDEWDNPNKCVLSKIGGHTFKAYISGGATINLPLCCRAWTPPSQFSRK